MDRWRIRFGTAIAMLLLILVSGYCDVIDSVVLHIKTTVVASTEKHTGILDTENRGYLITKDGNTIHVVSTC